MSETSFAPETEKKCLVKPAPTAGRGELLLAENEWGHAHSGDNLPRVKTLSSELSTPKNPATRHAGESCHWMAYLRNSPNVEASSTAKKPMGQKGTDFRSYL